MTDDTEKCPVCAGPLKDDDICATDIEMGTCHAACLEGSPVVDLETGEPLADDEVDTFRYREEASEDNELVRMRVELRAKETEALGYLKTVGALQEMLANFRAASPVAYLREGSPEPIQGVPLGAIWITDETDPKGFPVYTFSPPCETFARPTPSSPAPEVGREGRRGDWMQTVSGRQFWPLDPRPEDVFIEDIAHALSMMCRFNGHCERFYSVAEHSVLVSENVPPEDALWALLHDASEAYIADIVRPAKRFINVYKQMESNIMAAVCGAFDLPYIEPPSVKRADNAILADEASQIMGSKPKEWTLPEPPLGVRIIGLSPAGAKLAFLNRYRALTEGTAHG